MIELPAQTDFNLDNGDTEKRWYIPAGGLNYLHRDGVIRQSTYIDYTQKNPEDSLVGYTGYFATEEAALECYNKYKGE